MTDKFIENVSKYVASKLVLRVFKKLIADGDINTPIGFYKELRSHGIYIHSRYGRFP